MEKGGIDLMLVGVGMNGHIGFNEPGVPVDNYSHVIDLDNATQSVGQKYFKNPTKLKKGITLGLNNLLQTIPDENKRRKQVTNTLFPCI